MKGKKWILAVKFKGEPAPSNFKLIEEDIDENLNTGEVICEAVYLSVDPYMRVIVNDVNEVMKGEQVARVTKTKHSDFRVGSLVLGRFGWRNLTKVSDPSMIRPIPELGELSPSLALGSLGMTGLTAYYGVLDVLKVKAGETFVVNAAAGAVGSVAGQIAKLKVGGEFTKNMLSFMKTKGRIAICGSISTYGMEDRQPAGSLPYLTINRKTLTVQAFLVYHYSAEWPDALKEMIQWVKEGKIKYRETITDGFDKMVDAFIGLFKGTNMGKAVVKC